MASSHCWHFVNDQHAAQAEHWVHSVAPVLSHANDAYGLLGLTSVALSWLASLVLSAKLASVGLMSVASTLARLAL